MTLKGLIKITYNLTTFLYNKLILFSLKLKSLLDNKNLSYYLIISSILIQLYSWTKNGFKTVKYSSVFFNIYKYTWSSLNALTFSALLTTFLGTDLGVSDIVIKIQEFLYNYYSTFEDTVKSFYNFFHELIIRIKSFIYDYFNINQDLGNASTNNNKGVDLETPEPMLEVHAFHSNSNIYENNTIVEDSINNNWSWLKIAALGAITLGLITGAVYYYDIDCSPITNHLPSSTSFYNSTVNNVSWGYHKLWDPISTYFWPAPAAGAVPPTLPVTDVVPPTLPVVTPNVTDSPVQVISSVSDVVVLSPASSSGSITPTLASTAEAAKSSNAIGLVNLPKIDASEISTASSSLVDTSPIIPPIIMSMNRFDELENLFEKCKEFVKTADSNYIKKAGLVSEIKNLSQDVLFTSNDTALEIKLLNIVNEIIDYHESKNPTPNIILPSVPLVPLLPDLPNFTAFDSPTSPPVTPPAPAPTQFIPSPFPPVQSITLSPVDPTVIPLPDSQPSSPLLIPLSVKNKNKNNNKNKKSTLLLETRHGSEKKWGQNYLINHNKNIRFYSTPSNNSSKKGKSSKKLSPEQDKFLKELLVLKNRTPQLVENLIKNFVLLKKSPSSPSSDSSNSSDSYDSSSPVMAHDPQGEKKTLKNEEEKYEEEKPLTDNKNNNKILSSKGWKYYIKNITELKLIDSDIINMEFIISYKMVRTFINEFWKDIMSKTSPLDHYSLLLRVCYEHGNWITLDNLRVYNKEDKDMFIANIVQAYNNNTDAIYDDCYVKTIYIKYLKVETSLHSQEILKINHNPMLTLKQDFLKMLDYKIPLNNKYETWGHVEFKGIGENGVVNFIRVKDTENQRIYHIYIQNFTVSIELRSIVPDQDNYNNNNNSLNINTDKANFSKTPFLEVEDISTKIQGKNTIIRKFKKKLSNYELYIQNGKVVFEKGYFKTEHIQTINKDKKTHDKIITFDIETLLIKNQHIPYCICFFDGANKNSFYLTDYLNQKNTLFSKIYSVLSSVGSVPADETQQNIYKDASFNMIVDFLNLLFKPKYSGYIVYAHNLSNFDGILIFSALISFLDKDLIKIDPIIKGGQIINIKVNYGKNFKFNLTFRDSYKLLSFPLKDLTKQFNSDDLSNSETQKTMFPHKFLQDSINLDNHLNYIGPIPDKNYFYNYQDYTQFIKEFISSDTVFKNLLNNYNINYNKLIRYQYKYYKNYTRVRILTVFLRKNNNIKLKNKRIINKIFSRKEPKNLLLRYIKNYNTWSLKDEAIKYCLNDCVSLHKVLMTFNRNIFNKFKVSIKRFPTISSLTMGIFRSNYLKNLHKRGFYIPLIKDELYQHLKRSYTGGSTDMFIPRNPEGTQIYCYDVNSLYPTTMINDNFMPVVSKKKDYITYFKGNIFNFIDGKFNRPFGFFNVDVKTPDSIKHPILQIHFNTGLGTRTISPLGEWKSMYLSEELFNAQKYGYKYNVTSGFLFEKNRVFDEFIFELFSIKEKQDKNQPWYTISKLLMNSLYGRFGMSPDLPFVKFVKNSEIVEYAKNFEISEVDELYNSENSLIHYKLKNNHKNNLDIQDIINGSGTQAGTDRENSIRKSLSVSVPIAAAITAYARIHMSHFKNDPNYNIFYTDTDSLFIDKPLTPKFIGKKLGQFKLEYVLDKAVFLAPKLYSGVFADGKDFSKVKGYSNSIGFSNLEKLLVKDTSLNLLQDKWYKSFIKGEVSIKNEIYTLTVTLNKRQLVYKDNILIGTKPFIIENEKIVNSNFIINPSDLDNNDS